MAEHGVEGARLEPAPAGVAVAAEQPDPLPHLGRFGRDGGLGGAQGDRIGVDAGDQVPGPGQAHRLGGWAAADVQHPQGRPSGQLLGELPGDQFVADEPVQAPCRSGHGPAACRPPPRAGSRSWSPAPCQGSA
ncbi:hypothetical protein GCM10025734_27900 [Kitasatospora paranensis]